MATNPIRRTQFITDRKMQMRFARFVIAFVFISAIVTGAAIFFTTFLLMGEKLANVYPQGRLEAIFRSVFFWALVSLGAVMPFIFWGAIVFSHRIAGPLPKIYRILGEIGGGNFDQRVTLRKGDELVDLANAINDMAQKLKERQSPR